MRTALLRLPRISSARWAAGLSLLHLLLALLYKHGVGIDIEADPTMTWDWLWQALPAEALRTDLWRSLWNLHSQPPLFNLYGALLIRLSPAHHLQLMHYANVLLGALLVGMIFTIARRASGSTRAGLAAGLLVALHPGMFLAEAYVLYELLTVFFVTSAIFFLSEVRPGGSAVPAILFVGALACLVLTRSLFHLVLLPIALLFVLLVVDERVRKTVLFGGLLICLIPAGWYAKNLAKFGFFGSSSWYGMNFWNAVSFRYAKSDLMRFVEEGVLDPVAADVVTEHKRSFFRPSAYEKHGFDRRAEELVLSLDDYNNINIPDISRVYFRNALQLVRRDAGHYLGNVGWAYRQYASPPFRDPHHTKNIQRLPMHIHEFLYYRLLEGQWAANRIGDRFGGRSLGSFFFLLLPLGLVAYAVLVCRSCGKQPRSWMRHLRVDAAMAFTAILVIYTTVVGCTFEVNENARFRFLVSPILLAFLVVLGSRIVSRRTSGTRRRREAGNR
jgi:4-amino-4-deoxy-L-arabinose transferase-like glycosyltransferase